MEETVARQQALAKQDDKQVRVRKTYDLSNVPVFASTNTIRVDLSPDGEFWIEIKEELDFGEQTILDNAAVTGILREQGDSTSDAGSTVRLDIPKQRFLLCALWLTRWSIPNGEDGKSIRLPRHVNDRIAALKRLHKTWGEAIVDIITEHVAARMEDEEEAQDKANKEAMIHTEDNQDSPPQHGQNGESGGMHG